MSVLLCFRLGESPEHRRRRARARQSLERQGFGDIRVERHGALEMWLARSPKGEHGDAKLATVHAGSLAVLGCPLPSARQMRAIVETVARTGSMRAAIPPGLAPGTLALALRVGNRIYLASDDLDTLRWYGLVDGTVYATSWLTLVECMEQADLDPLSAAQYVIHGAWHGDRTPVSQVVAMPAGAVWHVGSPKIAELRVTPADFKDDRSFSTRAEAIDWFADHYGRALERLRTRFADRFSTALSGGFDSRLLLALLWSRGERPSVFVYGAPASPDVDIARAVCAGLGLRLEHHDKTAIDAAAPGGPDIEQAVRFFDGLPVDGAIDRGSDRMTRQRQNHGGRVSLNGGGGEILRNFFYLGDRMLSADAMVAAFYDGHLAGAFVDDRLRHAVRASMVNTLGDVLGVGSARTTRSTAELAYALFRCRYWMGRNNAIANRYGSFCTPLLDLPAVRAAASLPLSWKVAGAFEAALIHRVSADVAVVRCEYGLDLGRGPSSLARLAERMRYLRPISLRRWPTMVRNRRDGAPALHALEDSLASPLSLRDGAMSTLFRLDRLGEPGRLRRAATLEHLIRTRGLNLRANG